MTDKASKDQTVHRRVKPTLATDLPQGEDIKVGRDQILFGKGQWLPSVDPLVIGKENFADLQNLRYGSDSLETVKGHAKINTTPLATYLKVRAVHQLVTPFTTKSRVLAQAFNTGLTAARIVQNLSVIPAAADFESASLLNTLPATGRFSQWPAGHAAFSDGDAVSVWAGDEMPVAFASLSTHIDYHDEYTRYLRNDATGTGESIPLGYSEWMQIAGTSTGYGSSGTLKTNGDDGQAIAGRFSPERSGTIHGISVKLRRNGDPAGNLVVKVYAATGSYPDDCPDAATLIATSNTVSCSSLTTGSHIHVAFDFTTPWSAVPGTNYWVVLTADGSYVYSAGVYVSAYTLTQSISLKAIDAMAAAGTWNHKPATDEYLIFQVHYKVHLFLATSRPSQGFTCYIDPSYKNIRTATLAVEYAGYSGAAIGFTAISATDGTASSGKTMAAAAGKIAYTPTNLEEPVFVNGICLYFYRLSFSVFLYDYNVPDTGSPGYGGFLPPYMYQVTADCAFQPVKSLWSGESMVLLGFKIFDGAKNQDYTAYMNDESQTTGTETQLDAFATSKKIYIQTASPAQGFMFRFIPGAFNSNAAVMQIRRYQGRWVSVTDFVDKTSLAGAGYGQNGLVAFAAEADADKTLSLDGETPYYTYEFSFSAALSANVELFHVTAIEAPKSIDGYAFPFMFRNRPMLCGYVKGNEGNRVDFGMTDTVDIFSGSDASLGMNNSPLYFGGNENLTAAIEMYNRLGSTIYHVGVFCKAMETYLLSGYDAETFQIYRISGAIGCPAPQTIDTVEIGYGSEQSGELRCIALWISFVGPVLCDTATVTPIPGVECYFSRNDSRCINWSAIDRACAIVDLEYLEYHLCIPSGSGQATNNVWLVYDLIKRRWYPRVANDGNYPQAFSRVLSANGTPYVFACYDDGHMRRINTGDTWDAGGTAIACAIRSADILPTGDMWDATRIRDVKLLGAVAAILSVSITHYKNGAASGTALTAASLAATNRHARATQPAPVGLLAWSHQFLLSFTAPAGGAKLLGMAWRYTVEREDLTSTAGG